MLPNSSIQFLLNFIVTFYLEKSRCLFVFSDNDFDFKLENAFVRINVKDCTFFEDIIFRNHGCQDIIIQSNCSVDVLDNFEKQIRRNKDRFTFRRFLVISYGSNEEFDKFFRSESLQFIADLLYVFPKSLTKNSNDKGILKVENDVVYELWTHKFRGPNHSDPELVDVWFSENSSFLHNTILYSDKLCNQMGKPLRIAAFTYLPYSIVGDSLEKSDGTEMRVAITYAEKHNMTIEFVVNEEEQWGEIYNNWTGTGVLGEMVLDKGDFGFSALYTWEDVYDFLELSKPVVRTGITCLVPTPRLSAGWLMPLFSYTTSMWIAVGITFAFSSLFVWYLKSRTQNSHNNLTDSVIIVSAIFLQQSLPIFQLNTRMFIKYFILSLLVVSLFISTSYSSGLASSMTIPRYNDPIDTVQDLAKSNIFWGATSIAWVTSIENAEEQLYKTLVRKFLVLSEEELAAKARNDYFAFSVERLPFSHYAIGNYITEETVKNFKLMTEDLYWEQCVFVTRRNSVLLPSLDSLILRITESGLGSIWETMVTAQHVNAKVQKAVRYLATHHKSSEFVKLKWMHVEGAFGVLAIGSFLATGCFIMELIVSKLIRRRLPYTN